VRCASRTGGPEDGHEPAGYVARCAPERELVASVETDSRPRDLAAKISSSVSSKNTRSVVRMRCRNGLPETQETDIEDLGSHVTGDRTNSPAGAHTVDINGQYRIETLSDIDCPLVVFFNNPSGAILVVIDAQADEQKIQATAITRRARSWVVDYLVK
jgi:hypothetical protein